MGDAARSEPFEQVAKRLSDEFIETSYSDETPESIATAYLDYVLKRERIRRDATNAGQRQDAVDYETLETLKNASWATPNLLRPKLFFVDLELIQFWH